MISTPKENGMILPPVFEFNQGSLQDYVDCRRRFQLRYLLEQPWPAVEAEPAIERERYDLQGRRFHRLLERYYLGVPEEVIALGAQQEPLRRWWQAFREEPPLNLPKKTLPELRLAMTFTGQRLVAVFDLLAVDEGRRMVIVDWKTGRYRPPREMMESRLQTRVYPFLAAEVGARLFGGPVDPARVTMVYWFANYPDQPHVFHYDVEQHRVNGLFLTSLVEEVISARGDDPWPLTPDVTRCRFCTYRSLCDRGIQAGGEDEFLQIDEGEVVEFISGLNDVDEIVY